MKKSRFTESQIVAILKEAEGGIAITEVLRSHGISAATFYKWRSKYGGLEASELKRVKELEQQLSDYKTMVAELTRDNRALKNLIEKSSSAYGYARSSGLLGWRRTAPSACSMRGHRPSTRHLLQETGWIKPKGSACNRCLKSGRC